MLSLALSSSLIELHPMPRGEGEQPEEPVPMEVDEDGRADEVIRPSRWSSPSPARSFGEELEARVEALCQEISR